ncbi:MAG: hypothetical protein ACI81R_001578 [Bradymonadia bacterium]|jgi:hypothetical protein
MYGRHSSPNARTAERPARMSFSNPLLLLGLLAIAVPIAVHLINRQRAQRQPFPALAFLLKSNERIARSLKLKQWLLLALRIAVFALLPLAMAQPSLRCGAPAADAGDGRLPTSVVLVLDDSGSMSGGTSGDSRYAAALAAADGLIDDLRAWDEVAVVFASTTTDVPSRDLTDDHRVVSDAVQGRAPRFGTSDLNAALQEAAAIQRTSRLPQRRTVVFSDDTQVAWPSSTDAGAWADVGRLIFASQPAPTGNCAVTSLTWEPSGETDALALRFDADVRCTGSAAQAGGALAASLAVDGDEVAAARGEMDADGRATLQFVHRMVETDASEVRVTLEPTIGPSFDDERVAAWVADRRVRVLVINGDPRSVAYNDETFYLRRALQAGASTGAGADVRVVNADSVPAFSNDDTDVVVMANVQTLTVAQVAALRAFVERGGGLLIGAGNQVDATRYNSVFGDLLPKPIRDVKLLVDPDAPDAALYATRLAEVDALHPIFRVFAQPGGESIQNTRVFQYLLLVPESESAATIVASFGDGAPALVEHTVGRGRVMLWTSTLDIDWNDLAIRPPYLPFLHRTVDYLARRAGGGGLSVELGEPLRVDVSSLGAERLAVQSPSGEREVLVVESAELSVWPTEVGMHRVFAVIGGDEREVAELSFACNPPLAESDVTSMEAESLEAYSASTNQGTGDAERGVEAGERPLWPGLLFLLLIVIYMETLVSVRRRVWVGVRKVFGG